MSEQNQTTLRGADDYEAQYMGADEDVIYREKISYPGWFKLLIPLLMTLPLAIAGTSALVSGDVAAAALMAVLVPLMLLGALIMSTLRVSVTSKNLHVQYGLWGPSIPLNAIEHCEAEHYSLWKYGGYGIRYSISEKAWCYNMLGDKGQAVRVHWRDEQGKLHKTLVASESHTALANQINRARVALAATPSVAEAEESTLYEEEQRVDMSREGDREDLSLEEELAQVESALAEVDA
ncbi:MAG: hypothetical protein ACJAYU_001197 [Bradymonadia bacterium]|jgi:hypothetical protein